MKYNIKGFRTVVPSVPHQYHQEQTCHQGTCQMQTLRSHSRPTQSKSLGWGPGICVQQAFQGVLSMLKQRTTATELSEDVLEINRTVQSQVVDIQPSHFNFNLNLSSNSHKKKMLDNFYFILQFNSLNNKPNHLSYLPYQNKPDSGGV